MRLPSASVFKVVYCIGITSHRSILKENPGCKLTCILDQEWRHPGIPMNTKDRKGNCELCLQINTPLSSDHSSSDSYPIHLLLQQFTPIEVNHFLRELETKSYRAWDLKCFSRMLAFHIRKPLFAGLCTVPCINGFSAGFFPDSDE